MDELRERNGPDQGQGEMARFLGQKCFPAPRTFYFSMFENVAMSLFYKCHYFFLFLNTQNLIIVISKCGNISNCAIVISVAPRPKCDRQNSSAARRVAPAAGAPRPRE